MKTNDEIQMTAEHRKALAAVETVRALAKKRVTKHHGLFDACATGDLKNVKTILDTMAQENSKPQDDKDRWGRTGLHTASENEQIEIIKILCQRCPQLLLVKDMFGQNVLHRAVENGAKDCISLLCVEDINYQTRRVEAGDLTAFSLKGGLINGADSNGRTPLHLAAAKGFKETIQVLVHNGADLESRDQNFNDTPLHTAVRNSQNDCINTLIKLGANVHAPLDSSGASALHLAVVDSTKSQKSRSSDTAECCSSTSVVHTLI